MINELRLGNLTNFGKVIEINKVSFYVMDDKGEQAKSTWADIQPIPLTEEWLLKFGFVNREIGIFSFNNNMDLRLWGYEHDYSGLWIGEIKYVHQLQNLYFALTNEELTIKQ